MGTNGRGRPVRHATMHCGMSTVTEVVTMSAVTERLLQASPGFLSSLLFTAQSSYGAVYHDVIVK